MGLGFHIGQGGIDDLGEYLGDLDIEDHYWLQKNGFLMKGSTGHLPEDPEISLPYHDDVILTHEQVLEIESIFESRLKEVKETPGFSSDVVAKMRKIIKKLVAEEKGLSTCAD